MKRFVVILLTVIFALGSVFAVGYGLYMKNIETEPETETVVTPVETVSAYTAETIDFSTWEITAAKVGDLFVNRYFMVESDASFSFYASTSSACIIHTTNADGEPVLYRDAPDAEDFRLFEPVGEYSGNYVYYLQPNADEVPVDEMITSYVGLSTDATIEENYGDVSASMFFLSDPAEEPIEEPSDEPSEEPTEDPVEETENFFTKFKTFVSDNFGMTILVVVALVGLIVIAVVVSKQRK